MNYLTDAANLRAQTEGAASAAFDWVESGSAPLKIIRIESPTLQDIYFPLELKLKDYVRRLVDCVANGFNRRVYHDALLMELKTNYEARTSLKNFKFRNPGIAPPAAPIPTPAAPDSWDAFGENLCGIQKGI